jgi:hypothetical protein
MMTRAERRRMERESGSRTTYQFTLEQIEAMKRQAVLMSVSARILCEKFHWKGVRDENDHRTKLLQFSEAIVKEVNRICGDENADIRKYRDETYELYGVKYEVK